LCHFAFYYYFALICFQATNTDFPHFSTNKYKGKSNTIRHFTRIFLPIKIFASIFSKTIEKMPHTHLKYHKATFELLSSFEKPVTEDYELFESVNLTPIVSQTLLDSLNEVEQKCKITLPPSLKEWYSIQSAVDIMDSCICCNTFHSPDDWCQLKDVPKEWALRPAWIRGANYKKDSESGLQAFTQQFIQNGFLMLLTEEQGVSHWAIKLNDHSENPPVWIEFDSWPDYVWQKYTHTFSDFIYEWVWEYLRYPHKLYLLAYSPESINLTPLQNHFSSSPPVCLNFDEKKKWRFRHEDQGIEIEEERHHLLWHLSATSPNSLLKLASQIWTLGYRLTYVSRSKKTAIPPEFAEQIKQAQEAFKQIKSSGNLAQVVSEDEYRDTFFQ
jgi:hypothetical protein